MRSAAGLPGLHVLSKLVERHAPPEFVVAGRNARWKVVVCGVQLGTGPMVLERERDDHLAQHCLAGCFELHDFDHLLVRYKLDEVPMIGVSVRGGLACVGRLVVRERDPEGPALVCIEPNVLISSETTSQRNCDQTRAVTQREHP